jgi:hypothetical protein
MAVIKMGLIPGQELEYQRPRDSTSSLTWRAVTNNNLDTSAIVYQYGLDIGLLPLPYISPHPFLTGHLCRSVKVRQDSGAPRHWTIEASYSSAPVEDGAAEENPLNKPAKITWRSNQYRQAIFEDIDGRALLNSAGDWFDPPVEVDRSRWTATVSKNVATVPSYILDYEDAINNNSFTIAGVAVEQYTAKIQDISISELKIEKEFLYYEFSYTLEFRREKWQPYRILDQGLRRKVTKTVEGQTVTNLEHIMDISTPPRPITSPVLLDLAGDKLANPGPNTARFRQFSVYYARSFAVLPGLN